MKCKVCGGTGVIQGQAPGLVSCCPACDGKGFIELTNEEWLRSISTRELAKNLALLMLYDMPLYDRLHNSFEGGESAVIDACEKWLKEIHDEM